MKKRYFILSTVFVFFLSALSAQSYWSSKKTTANNLPVILQVLNDSTVFVRGDYKAISVTRDGGGTWTDLSLPSLAGSNEYFANAFFTSPSSGICATLDYDIYQYNFYKTSDGGATWDTTGGRFKSPDFNMLYFAGFQYWHFFDSNNGVAWGVALSKATSNLEPVIFKTTDGAVTWTYVEPASSFSSSYNFLDPHDMNNWFACNGSSSSANPDIYKTTDGGSSWTMKTSNSGATEVTFGDANTGWGIADKNMQGQLVKTTDGGENWTAYSIPTSYGSHYGLSIKRISAFDGQNILIGGADLKSIGVVLRSSDGGTTWALDSMAAPFYKASDVGPTTGVNYFSKKIQYCTMGFNFGKITDAPTGVSILNTNLELNTWPNPATDVVHIGIGNSEISKACITVFDAAGRLVTSSNVPLLKSDFVLSTAGMSPGIYFLKIATADQGTLCHKKVIIT